MCHEAAHQSRRMTQRYISEYHFKVPEDDFLRRGAVINYKRFASQRRRNTHTSLKERTPGP